MRTFKARGEAAPVILVILILLILATGSGAVYLMLTLPKSPPSKGRVEPASKKSQASFSKMQDLSTIPPGQVRFALETNPTTLDPALISDVMGGTIAAKLYNGLVRFKLTETTIEPDIASSWTVSPDGRRYIFTLRQNVRFTDGETVTSYSFINSMKRLLRMKPPSPRRWVLEKISGAMEYASGETTEVLGLKACGAGTLEITLSEPFAPFIGLLAMPNAYLVKESPASPVGVIGTGPYILKEFKRDEWILLEKNPDYFESSSQDRNSVTSILYRIIPDEMTARAEFARNTIDVLTLSGTSLERFIDKANNADYEIMKQPKLNVYYLGMNCSVKPFDDVRVRRAMNYAIDKDEIIRTLLNRTAVKARGPIPPGLNPLEEIEPADEITYNPAEARRLLAEAGYPEGIKIEIWHKSSTLTASICQLIQAQLKKAGIEAKLQTAEWSALKASINKGGLQCYLMNWSADYPDCENFLVPLFHSKNMGPGGNRAFFKNAEIDALLDKAVRTVDDMERARLYRDIEKKIMAFFPWVPLYHEIEYAAVKKRLKGYRLPLIYNADKGTGYSL